MSKAPPKKRQKLTALAGKYGHPVGSPHEAIKYDQPFKSGLTPVSPGIFLSTEDRDKYEALVRYQRQRFDGRKLPFDFPPMSQ